MVIYDLIEKFACIVISENNQSNFINVKFELKNNQFLTCLTKNLIDYEISIVKRIGEFGYIEYNDLPTFFKTNKVKTVIDISKIHDFLMSEGIRKSL